MNLPDSREPRAAVRAWRAGLSALALAALAACSHQGVQPSVKALDTDRLGVQGAEPAPVSMTLAPWWEACGDAQLNQLIDQALRDSPSMQVTATRLQRVQALERLAHAAEMPKVQATGKAERQRFTEHGLVPPPIAGSTRTIGTLQLEGAWELDLFGKLRAEMDAAIGQTRAAEADLQAARLLLSSQVARQYVQLGRLQAQRMVAQRTLAQREDMLKLIRQRVDAGLDTAVELKQGEGALPDTRQQVEALDEQIMLARHALAVLSGQAPNALDSLTVAFDTLRTPELPQSLPLDLLARRADVMAARWRVESASRQSDAARTLFYPNIDLSTYAGYNAIGLDRLIKPGSFQWGLLPAIHLPLFDGDQRMANLSGRVAEQDAAVATYNQTVLQAVQEVADQLGSVQAVARQRTEQEAAQRHIEAAYALALERYKAGLGSYLIVLNAETAVLAQRRQAVDLQARALEVQVNLIRAVGGSLAAPQPAGATPQASSSSNKSSGDRS